MKSKTPWQVRFRESFYDAAKAAGCVASGVEGVDVTDFRIRVTDRTDRTEILIQVSRIGDELQVQVPGRWPKLTFSADSRGADIFKSVRMELAWTNSVTQPEDLFRELNIEEENPDVVLSQAVKRLAQDRSLGPVEYLLIAGEESHSVMVVGKFRWVRADFDGRYLVPYEEGVMFRLKG